MGFHRTPDVTKLAGRPGLDAFITSRFTKHRSIDPATYFLIISIPNLNFVTAGVRWALFSGSGVSELFADTHMARSSYASPDISDPLNMRAGH